ncbi:MAG: hypothetical protein KatS3mg109_2072 [Pirellulaceae bacterium]|nr:MAG: hypothetical protein KatS3mg109_2072 [Pirellulaceae bacterium]
MIRGIVIFMTGYGWPLKREDFDWRFDGQALPSGSVPVVTLDDAGNIAVLHGFGDHPVLRETVRDAIEEAAAFDPHWNSVKQGGVV